jgi:uncharacterized membrane protein YobD (UPF0266 family)
MGEIGDAFNKKMKREKIIQVIIFVIIFVYFYFTTNDSDVGTAKLLFALILLAAYLEYRIDKLEKLIINLHKS